MLKKIKKKKVNCKTEIPNSYTVTGVKVVKCWDCY